MLAAAGLGAGGAALVVTSGEDSRHASQISTPESPGPAKDDGGALPAEETRFPMQFYGGGIDLRQLDESDYPPEVRPGYIKFGSGEGWTIARWTSWGAPTATAIGTYRDHSDYESTGTITLSNPRKCGKYRLYTVLKQEFDVDPPAGYMRREAPLSLEQACY